MTDANFILIGKTKNQTADYDLKKSIFRYYIHKARPTLLLGYTLKPLYANFKNKWFSTHFRLLMFLICLMPVIPIAINFSNTFWWYVAIAIPTPFAIWTLIYVIWDCVYKIRIKLHIASINVDKSIIGRYGVPGSGKTSSLFFDMKIMADKMWQKIKEAYILLIPYLNEIRFWPTALREDAEEIIEAYRFYKESGTYPCLWSTVPAFVDGVPVNIITQEHLMQQKKMPYGACCILDEISVILPPELFRNKPIEIKEMCKFPRHFGDFHFGSTEQGEKNMLIDFRNSTAENKCMIEQKWVLKPLFLIAIYNRLIDHYLNKFENTGKGMTKATANVLQIFHKFIKNIGFRKYYYFDSGNENEQVKSKTKTFILPPYLNVTYDSRAFKNGYRCKDKPLEVSKCYALRLSSQELEKIFIKKEQLESNTQKQKKAKREKKKRDQEEMVA